MAEGDSGFRRADAVEREGRQRHAGSGFHTRLRFGKSSGLKYMGPINGHESTRFFTTLEEAKEEDGPVLIHALTVKGKGYEPAERDKAAWHGTSAFEIATGKFIKEPATAPAYTAVFAQATIDLMKEDERIVAITAAMPDGTGLSKVMKEFPDRTFDTAIAEQHAVTFAAGMATEGLKPIAAIYSRFLQRAYDQIFHDVVFDGTRRDICARPSRSGRSRRADASRADGLRLPETDARICDHGSQG